MKFILAIIAAELVPVSCVIGAFYLMLHDKTGWGWLILVAILGCGATIKCDSTDDPKPGEGDKKSHSP